MRVLITGACGYVGSVLIPKLYRHEVTTLDIGWFGGNPDFKKDVRDFYWEPMYPIDAVIHLAGVANDPCGELDPRLAWEINVLGTMKLAEWAVKTGVKQFIYASSGSVYGVSESPEVVETDPLNPISDYNKTKMCAERVLLSYSDKISVKIIRPATVCGWSPRMRLDVMVNSFVIQALTKGVITYNGGEQYRPNIHIDDMTDLYAWLLETPHARGIYNAGFENLQIKQIAKIVADIVGCEVRPADSFDKRSYRINSGKLLWAGFRPKKRVVDAIVELIDKFNQGQLKDEEQCYNLKMMKAA